MNTTEPTAKDRYLGCLLGQGIGDALGIAGLGLTRDEVQSRYGRIEDYQPLRDADGNVLTPAGQFSDNTELALCLAETLATSNGFIDPETAGYRFAQVLRGDYAHFLGQTTRTALERAVETDDYQNGLGGEGTAGASPAGRVPPVALIHALSDLSTEMFVREVLRSALITHAHPESVNGALAVAYATWLAVRREMPPELIISEVLAFIDEDAVAQNLRRAEVRLRERRGPEDDPAVFDELGTSGYVAEAVATALYIFGAYGEDYRGAVLTAANLGGASSTIGAIVGALNGAWVGAEALPPDLVDGLEGRMYIIMAAPALLRVAQLRAGLFLHLHQN